MKKVLIYIVIILPFAAVGQTKTTNVAANTSIEFIENAGQVTDELGAPRPDVLFTARLNGAKAYITRRGIHYVFYGATETYRVDVQWQDAAITGSVANSYGQKAGSYNFYLPHCPQGITGVRAYEKIELKDVYPNIDVVLYSRDNWLEYDFVVRPGGDISNIKIQYCGASPTQNPANGNLLIKTPLGEMTEEAPVAYQNGKKIEKTAFYTHHNGSIGIAASSDYNRSETLVIDPVIKIWGTYYGGTEADQANTIFTDRLGNVYIGGTTYSNNNIAFNGHRNNRADSSDVFVAKFDKNGTRLWATYYGGENKDLMGKIFTNITENEFYLCGTTFSDSAIAYNGYQMEKGGNGNEDDCDAFLVMFDSSGLRIWGTYLGGYDADIVYGGATDAIGNIYISGSTLSPTGIGFSGYQNTYGDAYTTDAFFAKYSKNGILQWSTYFGSLFSEDNALITAGKKGEIYIAGYVQNDGLAYKGYKNNFAGGGKDVYIARFDAVSCSRVWVSYFGGPGYDDVRDITTDADGNICITGYTESTTEITHNGHRSVITGNSDVYVAKFDTTGKPVWSTYYGGENDDEPLSITTDREKNVYISGKAFSNGGINTGGFTIPKAGKTDAFVAKFSHEAGIPEWGGYFGGNGDENGYCAVDSSGMVYLCGATNSPSMISHKGHQDTIGGSTDAYLIKFSPHTAFHQPIVKQIFCPGDNMLLKYNIPLLLDSANTFVMQLSDSSGNFSSAPVQSVIKSGFVPGADSLIIKLPGNLPGGAKYRVRLVSDAPADSIVSKEFTVRENPPAKIAVRDTLQCLKGNKFIFMDSSHQPVQTWLWEFGDGDASASPNPPKTYAEAGEFNPVLKITDIYGCTGSATTTVTVLPTPGVGFEVNTTQMCLKNNSFSFKDTTQGDIVSYKWTFGDNSPQTTQADATKSYLTDGTFVVWHSATNSDGCTDSSAQVIRVFPQPVTPIITGDDAVSQFSSHIYSVVPNGSNFYSWVVDDGTILSGNGTNSIVVHWGSNALTGKVKVVEISIFGCYGDTVELSINIQPTGINAIEKNKVVVYPNPVNGWLMVDAGEETITRLVCYDVFGKAIELLPTADKKYLTQQLTQGVYMVRAYTQTGTVFTAKFIKQ